MLRSLAARAPRRWWGALAARWWVVLRGDDSCGPGGEAVGDADLGQAAVSADLEGGDRVLAVGQVVEEVAVAADCLVEGVAAGAEIGAAAAGVEQGERSVLADREAGDRARACIRG